MTDDHKNNIKIETEIKGGPEPETKKNYQSRTKHCSVKSCGKPVIRGHVLPANKYRRARWMEALEIKESDIKTRYFHVCSEHFTKADYMPSKF